MGGDDQVNAGSGSDYILSGLNSHSRESNDINGGSGYDTVRYFGNRNEYTITPPPNTANPGGEYTITNLRTGRSDTIKNIERLRFNDRTVYLPSRPRPIPMPAPKPEPLPAEPAHGIIDIEPGMSYPAEPDGPIPPDPAEPSQPMPLEPANSNKDKENN